jgi:hypothetical protein
MERIWKSPATDGLGPCQQSEARAIAVSTPYP